MSRTINGAGGSAPRVGKYQVPPRHGGVGLHFKLSFYKIIVNRAFHVLVNFYFGTHCRDLSNNLNILQREVAQNIKIESDDFAANAETGLNPSLNGLSLYGGPHLMDEPLDRYGAFLLQDYEDRMGASSFIVRLPF